MRLPFTSNVLPLPIVRTPLLVKLPVVVKLRPPVSAKCPVAVLLAKFAKPLFPIVGQ